MMYAVEMSSGGMICMRSFMTICSGIQVALNLLMIFCNPTEPETWGREDVNFAYDV
jgi:hypothetical protein